MVEKRDIVWLGVASGVSGSLIGGLMLGVGISLVISGHPGGWLLLVLGAPVSAAIGWVMARRLAMELG